MGSVMSKIASFKDVIELWDSREAMAADIGTTVPRVTKWFQRDSIPAGWWVSLLATHKARAAGVSAEMLTRLAARETAEARA